MDVIAYTPPTVSSREPSALQEPLDLTIVGGRLLDDRTGTWRKADVGISDGRISAIADYLTPTAADRTIVANDALILPGLIDFHTHVYWGSTPLGVNPDVLAARSGVTTWVDAGSAGAGNLEGLVRHVVDRSKVTVKLFLNVSFIGLLPVGHTDLRFGELFDHRLADSAACLREIDAFREHVVGVKVRIGHDSTGPNGLDALRVARSVCDATGLPLMAHVSTPPPLLADVLPYLFQGDIVTHCYTAGLMGILDRHRRVLSAVSDARGRGVLFDVGHGAGSFTFDVAEAAMAEGFVPDIISSDLHAYNVDGPVFDLTTTLMKFLALGMSLEEVIPRATTVPASVLGLESYGITMGARADLTVARYEPEHVVLGDAHGEIRKHDNRLSIVETIVNGSVLIPGEGLPQGKRKPGLPAIDSRLTRPWSVQD